ncbi:hypothetical protein MVEN_01793900 [Mycena venus]|uniref:Uncharacterized protein n=1 Tax=Mycena venus TaxID=2733690 RepID=A0A8H6XKC9_9AGAR|nr:hypothetical protein MVEN_01793900 [Mycena venus]
MAHDSVPPMTDTFLSQLLSLAPVALIPFIPNDALRYITLGIATVAFVAYSLRHNTLSSRISALGDLMREMEELFYQAADECGRDPYFLAEAGLKLATLRYNISTIRTRWLSAKRVPWKKYPLYLKDLAMSIRDCQRESRELRLSISIALESVRQHKYLQDLRHRKTTLRRPVPPADV